MPKGAKFGGRKKGTPNKATADVRAFIALIAKRNISKVEQWLNQVEDPAKRVGLFLDMLEYYIPKLARTEHTTDVKGVVVRIGRTDGDL